MKRRAISIPVAVLVSFIGGLLYAWILQARVTTQTVQMVLAKLGATPDRVISKSPGRSDITRRAGAPESRGKATTESLMDRLDREGELHWERPASG